MNLNKNIDNLSIFVPQRLKTMLRSLLDYFNEYYNQDAVMLWGKTFAAMFVLNIPQYMPEVQGGAKLITTIVGLGSAVLGFVLIVFRFIDEVKKRTKK
jgi:hypothetical protein